ncbi:MAG TPA: MarR family winged helix-turn-helix transcriptional regulator [Candidatus Limnocylindrales bacterium]|nr:MarR family winged helix-turn-helix transcriptional regulator [Candidatus Limnocylindrales bacterium]
MSNPPDRPAPPRSAGDCVCLNLRQAARAVTQLYDEALRPCGLRATQLGLLAMTHKAGSLPISRLAELLVMDRTTLTRNIKPLEKQGLICTNCGDDKRIRSICLTEEGKAALQAALPLWEEVQRQVVAKLGAERLERMLEDLTVAIGAARQPSGTRLFESPHDCQGTDGAV